MVSKAYEYEGCTIDNVGVVLLAGGTGSRMKANMPKQFLDLAGKPVLQHTLELFLSLDGITQVVLVLGKEFQESEPWKSLQADNPKLIFALPVG